MKIAATVFVLAYALRAGVGGACVAVKVEQRRLPRARRRVPGDNPLAVLRFDYALGDAVKACVGWKPALCLRQIYELALAEIHGEPDQA